MLLSPLPIKQPPLLLLWSHLDRCCIDYSIVAFRVIGISILTFWIRFLSNPNPFSVCSLLQRSGPLPMEGRHSHSFHQFHHQPQWRKSPFHQCRHRSPHSLLHFQPIRVNESSPMSPSAEEVLAGAVIRAKSPKQTCQSL